MIKKVEDLLIFIWGAVFLITLGLAGEILIDCLNPVKALIISASILVLLTVILTLIFYFNGELECD